MSKTTNGNTGHVGRPKGTGKIQKAMQEPTDTKKNIAEIKTAKLEKIETLTYKAESAEYEGGTINVNAVMEELALEGITKRPSNELMKSAALARNSFISGIEKVAQVFKQATSEGYDPLQARRVVWVLVAGRGKYLSDRQMRKGLPQIGKLLNMARPPPTPAEKAAREEKKKEIAKDREQEAKEKEKKFVEKVQPKKLIFFASATMAATIAKVIEKHPTSRLEFTTKLVGDPGHYVLESVKHGEGRGPANS